MSVQIYILETIKSPETNFNLKKMKVVSLRLLKYYAHLLLLVITSQNQVFIRTIERKVQKTIIKIFILMATFSKQPFALLACRSLRNNLC